LPTRRSSDLLSPLHVRYNGCTRRHTTRGECMTAQPQISGWQAWLLAARPKTLPAAVAPVLVGTAVALHDNAFRALPALAAMLGALLLQIGVKIANVYCDYVRGVDLPHLSCPSRATLSRLYA